MFDDDEARAEAEEIELDRFLAESEAASADLRAAGAVLLAQGVNLAGVDQADPAYPQLFMNYALMVMLNALALTVESHTRSLARLHHLVRRQARDAGDAG